MAPSSPPTKLPKPLPAKPANIGIPAVQPSVNTGSNPAPIIPTEPAAKTPFPIVLAALSVAVVIPLLKLL